MQAMRSKVSAALRAGGRAAKSRVSTQSRLLPHAHSATLNAYLREDSTSSRLCQLGVIPSTSRSFATASKPVAAEAPKDGAASQPAPVITDNIIVDITMENFAPMVMQSPVPVILDCHAEWCEPCKKLGPLLEGLVRAAGGRIRLAKLDVDQNQDLAMRLQIQNLPSVFGVHEGRVIDTFTGMQQESLIRTFVDNLLRLVGAGDPSTPTAMLAKAHKLAAEMKFEESAAIYKEVITAAEEKKPVDKDTAAQALAGLARVAAAAGHEEASLEIVKEIRKKYSPEIKFIPEVAQTVSAIELNAKSSGSDNDTIKELVAAVETDPNDHEKRHQLALALFHELKYEEAIDQGIELLKRGRNWNEGAAKALLLQIFEALGPGNELAKKGRSRMTNYLFV